MTPRDAAYLSTVHELANGGWCQVPRGRRLDVSGLTWSQWRSAQAAAKDAGLVEVLNETEAQKRARRRDGGADPVRLTEAGRSAVESHRVRIGVSHRGLAQVGTPLGNEPISFSERTLRDEEPNKAVRGAKRIAQGGVRTGKPRALDRLAYAMERIAAAEERKAAAAEQLALVNVERCGCGRVKERAPKKGPDGKPTTFLRCPAWKTCPDWNAKPPERETEEVSGPRVSSMRSEEERRERMEARARALAESKSVT